MDGKKDRGVRVSQQLVKLFQQLGCEVRLELLCVMAGGGMAVTSLARRLELSISTVSGHLRRLTETGLVKCARRGRTRIYSLDDRVAATPAEHGVGISFQLEKQVVCSIVVTLPDRTNTSLMIEPKPASKLNIQPLRQCRAK